MVNRPQSIEEMYEQIRQQIKEKLGVDIAELTPGGDPPPGMDALGRDGDVLDPDYNDDMGEDRPTDDLPAGTSRDFSLEIRAGSPVGSINMLKKALGRWRTQ